jgi:hypothetical protein
MAAPAPDMTPQQTLIRAHDLELALIIAAGGGMRTHDKLGTVSEDVWSQYRDTSTLGKLVEAKDIRKLLLDQIQVQLDAKKDMLLEVESDKMICQWIIRYTKSWEEEYSKNTNKTFDIGRKILAIMHDALFEVRDILNMPQNAFSLADIEDAVARAHEEHDTADYKLLQGDDAVVRFLFRNEHTRFHMVRIASRLLQKKEVCNRAGAYSAKQQRHDVTQEKDAAVTGLYHAVEDGEARFAACRALLDSNDFEDYIADYTSFGP